MNIKKATTAKPHIKFIGGIALIFACFSCMGQVDRATKADAESACGEIFNLAKSIMTQRQAGAEMPAMIELVKDNEIFVAIVRDAYNRPTYTTRSYIEREITDFSNNIYNQCLTAFYQLVDDN